jgi:shikimate kinase / 3-dehydroquinate synthase
VYAECHAELATDGLSVEDIAEAVCAVAAREPLVLPLGERTYTIDVVLDRPEALTDAIARVGPSSLVVITDAVVRRARGAWLDTALSHLALPRTDVTLAAGEDQKTIASMQAVWDAALGARVDRDALIVAFGGGVITDIAGFAAATVLRGIRFVSAPTTLLGMVDASIGGKTGIDHASGKNLIGAIHQPQAVVLDVAHLRTLPARELRAGLAEIVKIALVADASLFAHLEQAADLLARGDIDAELTSIIRAAAATKAVIVRDDEHESGGRILLNLGHTVGHALEAHGGYRKYLHGEAIAIGLCAELDVFAQRGLTPPGVADRTRTLVARLGLRTDVSREERRSAARFIDSDKKRRRAHLRLPVVTAVGHADVRDMPLDLLTDP